MSTDEQVKELELDNNSACRIICELLEIAVRECPSSSKVICEAERFLHKHNNNFNVFKWLLNNTDNSAQSLLDFYLNKED